MNQTKVEWTRQAVRSLEFYFERIALDSPKNARMVKKEIILTARKLSKNSNIFQIDEYYPNNKGDIRRFFRWKFRIVYQVRIDKVVILDIFHTSLNPGKVR